MKNLTFYRTAQIDGLSIFLREAGANSKVKMRYLLPTPTEDSSAKSRFSCSDKV